MITKEAVDKNNVVRNIKFTSAARVGFEYLLRNLEFQKKEGILMPSYIGETEREGSGVFDPVRNTRISFDFYAINQDLSINIIDFEAKIASGRFKAALVIHYFGFIQSNIEYIAKLCARKNIVLIEDCAHTLESRLNNTAAGCFGDYSFFSIHKLVATDDGGFIQDNTNGEDRTSSTGNDLPKINLETLEQYCRTDISRSSDIRVKNYKTYLELIDGKSKDYDILFPALPNGIIPLNFPIIVKGGKREKLYYLLIEKGVLTCALYYRLISEIDPLKFPWSVKISGSIINLPVHQDIKKEEIVFISHKLSEAIKEL